MSEFNIVKCKKCDASLVELKGEKLSGCVQCGHQFNLISNTNKAPHAISNRLKQTPEYKKYLERAQNLTNSGAKPRTKTSTNTEAQEIIPKKKKSFSIGSIIFIIILFNVIAKIFGQ